MRTDAGDAGGRHEQVQLVHVRGQRGLDALVQRVQPRRGRVEIVQQAAEAPQRLRVERRGYCEFQRVALALHMAREARQNALGRAPLAQAVEDPAPVGTEDVGQHPAQAQSLIVERLLQALPHPGAVGDDLAPVPALLAQRTEGRRRHVAGPRQAVLADARQPQAVGHVRLAPADLLDVLGMCCFPD